jgi:thioredoxin reductase (NADPH)
MSASETRTYDVVIVGAGPAGMCAALYTGRSMLKTAVLERGVPGGELLNTEFLDDVLGFPRILGRDLAKLYADHAKEFGAEFHEGINVDQVKKVDDGSFEITTSGGTLYRAKAVIVTAGGTPSKLGVPGELEYAGQGVSYCAICDGAFFKDQVLAVAGGGDAACEEADYLTRFATKVYLVHRRDELRASPILRQRLLANPKVEVIWNTVIDEVQGSPTTGVTGLALRHVKTGATRVLPVGGLFVFIGFKPNTGVIADHIRHDPLGYVLTDTHMQSSLPGLFVAGDMRAQLTRQVTTALGDGTTAAIAVEKYLKALEDGSSVPEAQILETGGYAV